MRSSRLASGAVALMLVGLVLAACNPIPYEVSAPKSVERQLLQKPDETSGPRAIALCYSRAFNTPDEVLAEAKLICGSGQARYVDTDVIWTPCGLQQPVRATFICTPAP